MWPAVKLCFPQRILNCELDMTALGSSPNLFGVTMGVGAKEMVAK